MMNKFKHLILIIISLLSVFRTIQAQTNVRPYEQWEATQFIAVTSH